MMFLASTPAPLTATPAPPPNPAATEAAAAMASMEAVSSALITMSPAVEVAPWPASFIKALMALSMVLSAMETPIDTATPTPPPKAAAIEAAPAKAEMVDVSSAVSEMLSADIPEDPSPSMEACTSALIRLSAMTPEPLAPIPAPPPAPTATEPASTSALMVWPAVAVWVRVPPALILESTT